MDSFEQRHERGITNMGELLLKGYIMYFMFIVGILVKEK